MYSTPADVDGAIRCLTDHDYFRLHRVAENRLRALPYACADDLVVDVLGRTFEAACGGKGRRWKRHVDFMAHLFNSIRGVSSDLKLSASRSPVVFSGQDAEPGLPESATPPIDQSLMEEEEEMRLQEKRDFAYNMLRHHFQDDHDVQWIIHGIMHGLKPCEILKQSGMSRTCYETARRRWRRGAARLRQEFATRNKRDGARCGR